MALEAIKYSDGKLTILDQLQLPEATVFIDIDTLEDAWEAINKMKVRGAPAIALVGSLAVASLLERGVVQISTKADLKSWLEEKLAYLVSARPTAVNMQNAARDLIALASELLESDDVDVGGMKSRIVAHIVEMMKKDVEDNRAIGKHGAADISKNLSGDAKGARVLTHCNTGSLATCGYGTALGVIRGLNELGKLEMAYCTETRPYNQGARLTAFELVHDELPATLVCDSMAGALMRTRGVHAIVTGADRIAANGDTANKIGTYQLAVLAKHHNVPFYIAAPFTSVDFDLPNGDAIKIEERPANELTHINGKRIAAPGIDVWNPAFDVTPAELITGGIITEKGVFPADQLPRS